MLRFDRKKFFDGYREAFGPLSVIEVKGLSSLLDFIEADPHVDLIPEAAYLLATPKHETADTFHPIHEYGGKAYFVKRYGGQTRKGKELGNDTPDEGYYYAGKGYPQTTGESNYEKAEVALRREYPELVADFERRTGKVFDLTIGDQPDDLGDPANMMDPAIAYATMSYGMRTGMFTGRKLGEFINRSETDYKNARKTVNGMDKAQTIATYAVKFEKILRSAAVPAGDLDREPQAKPADGDPPAGVSTGADPQTEQPPTPPTDDSVAVERGDKEVPPGFFRSLWKEITAAFGTYISTDRLTDYAQQAQMFGLPPEFWMRIFYGVLIIAGVWFVHRVWKWWWTPVAQRRRTDALIAANTTPNNSVIPADAETLAALEAAGWTVVRRK